MNLVLHPVRRLLRALGIDRAVAYALLGQGAAMLLQPITLLMIARFLTKQEQGYFYAFGGVLSLQMFFDLGLGMATLQFVSHEAGLLSWTAEGTLAGDPAAKSRLISVVRLSVVWYAVVAAVVVLTLLPGGWIYFVSKDTGGVAWRTAWVWTVLATGGLLALVPMVQFLAACGKMAETMRVTAVQRIGSGLAQCLTLAVGGRLFGWPIAQSLGFAVFAYWLVRYWAPTFRDLFGHHGDGPKVSWWREVWPFQWKVALSGLVFFVSSQLSTLVLFDETPAGKEEAGRMGASLTVMGALISISATWLGARVPTFGHLVARRDWAGLDQVFRRVWAQSALVAVATAAAVWAVFLALRTAGWELGNRVLPPLTLGLLLVNVVVQHTVHALAAYLRAHKREPFLWLYVGFGLAMGAAVFTVGRAYGALGMSASLVLLNATVCLGGGGVIFVRCRRAWHRPAAAPVALDPTPA